MRIAERTSAQYIDQSHNESARQEKKEGFVIAVGTFEDGKELPLKKGGHVIYGGYQSDEIEIDGEKYLFVDFKDILATVEEE